MAEAYENLGKPDSAAAMYQRILDPRAMPFTHLTLRGLVFRFATERREALGRLETSAGYRAAPSQVEIFAVFTALESACGDLLRSARAG
jgi:hypothetical protein